MVGKGLEVYSIKKERNMKDRQKLLDEVFELALQNDMTYFG
jgi:hypothetical protein